MSESIALTICLLVACRFDNRALLLAAPHTLACATSAICLLMAHCVDNRTLVFAALHPLT
jgi:hypothetical protein